MKLGVKFSPDLVAVMAAEIKAGEKATTAAMRIAGAGLKQDWRQEVVRGGLGQRMANTIRNQTYPTKGESINAAAMVWTKSPTIIGAHADGALIRARRGSYLAVPLPAAGRGPGGKRLTPKQWEQRRGIPLRFVYRPRGPSLLVADGRLSARGVATASRSKTGRGRSTVPVFLLIPQVKLRKRLDLYRDAERAASEIPDLIVKNWIDGKLP